MSRTLAYVRRFLGVKCYRCQEVKGRTPVELKGGGHILLCHNCHEEVDYT